MVKQSLSRNHRSKGSIKIKHVLQICVLLAVCFWLIYQVKHSHDKKKAFDEHDMEISRRTNVPDEVLKFGRKYLQPRLEETTMKNDKLDEEETGVEDEEEEQQHKEEEKEVEGKGGGDEIDEDDQQISNAEIEHEEDFIDGEKEREEGEENDSEEKDGGRNENESSLEENERDGGGSSSRNAREAREQNYRDDDASSAVTHETEALTMETERSMDYPNENTERNSLESESKPNNTTGEMAENGISPNVTGKDDKESEIGSFKSEGGSLLNSTTTEFNHQPEVGNNSTEGSSETSNSSLQNRREMKPDEIEAQNATIGSDNDQSNLNLVISGNAENAEAATGGSSNSSTTRDLAFPEKIIKSGATRNEKSETSTGTDNADVVQHDPIDYYDSFIPLEEKDGRTDLDTLPEKITEGSNNEDAAAAE